MYLYGELRQCVEDARTALREWCEENRKGRDVSDDVEVDDMIWELADSYTPVYNYDALTMAAENLSAVACREVDHPAHDGKMTPANVAARAIFDLLYEELDEEWGNIRDQWRDEHLWEDEEEEDETE